MHISPRGVAFIAGFEGFSSRPYWDSYGGVWTRGLGETEGITRYSPPITRSAGEARLKSLIEQRYEWGIPQRQGGYSQSEWDALCSFLWNLGAGILQGRLGVLLRNGQNQAFADAILAYDHAGGVELLGLKRRREAERALFLSAGGGAPSPSDPLLPDEREHVRKFDALKKRSWLHPVAFRRQTLWIRARRKAIWRAAHGKGGWAANNRGARYRILKSRVSS